MAYSPAGAHLRSASEGPEAARSTRRLRADAIQQVRRIASEDLPDVGSREPVSVQQSAQVRELKVAGQDRPVIAIQVGADSHVTRPGHFNEPNDLVAEVSQRPTSKPDRPSADQPPSRGNRSHMR